MAATPETRETVARMRALCEPLSTTGGRGSPSPGLRDAQTDAAPPSVSCWQTVALALGASALRSVRHLAAVSRGCLRAPAACCWVIARWHGPHLLRSAQ